MKNKTIVFISIALAVFLLVVGTGIVTNVLAKGSSTGTATTDITTFMNREKEYQRLINEANQRIELANQQISNLVNSSSNGIETPESPYLFNSKQAAQIASNLTDTQPVKDPELVEYNGTPAFEVEFDDGQYVGKVYIDANTGRILYNTLQQKSVYITTEQAIAIAVNYLGGGTFSRIEFGILDGVNVYIVQFTNGQSVYIDLQGVIKAIQMAPSTAGTSIGSNESEIEIGDD